MEGQILLLENSGHEKYGRENPIIKKFRSWKIWKGKTLLLRSFRSWRIWPGKTLLLKKTRSWKIWQGKNPNIKNSCRGKYGEEKFYY